MIISLTKEEIKEALALEIQNKTQGIHGAINPEDCFFKVSNSMVLEFIWQERGVENDN